MSVKLLTEHHLKFLSYKGGCTGASELHLTKYHTVGNHMSWLKCLGYTLFFCDLKNNRVKEEDFKNFENMDQKEIYSHFGQSAFWFGTRQACKH